MYNSKFYTKKKCTQVTKLQETKLKIEVFHSPLRVWNEK